MSIALVIAGGLLGVTAVPHCAAMCGAPCAAIIGRGGRPRRRELAFHAGRGAGYAAAGAVAATGFGAVAALGQRLHALQPVWSLMHAAALALGLWLLLRGAMPAFRFEAWRAPASAEGDVRPVRWMTARAGAAGAIWFAWPCGVLQAALLIAALASDPISGAAVMLAFAATSSAGLWLAPALWRRLDVQGLRPWVARLAGLALVVGSGWALLHASGGAAPVWCGI